MDEASLLRNVWREKPKGMVHARWCQSEIQTHAVHTFALTCTWFRENTHPLPHLEHRHKHSLKWHLRLCICGMGEPLLDHVSMWTHERELTLTESSVPGLSATTPSGTSVRRQTNHWRIDFDRPDKCDSDWSVYHVGFGFHRQNISPRPATKNPLCHFTIAKWKQLGLTYEHNATCT